MAKFLLKDARLEVNGTVLSDHGNEVSVETSRGQVDVSGFGAVMTESLADIGDASITVTFFQDFAAGSIDAVLWPLSSSDTPFTVKVRPTSGAISATNPEYTMQSLLYGYTPISGARGAAATTPVTFRNQSPAGITRATS